MQNFLDETAGGFRSYKKLAEQAPEQISDEEFFQTIDEESNSMATIMKHVGGNLRSRWTDFFNFGRRKGGPKPRFGIYRRHSKSDSWENSRLIM